MAALAVVFALPALESSVFLGFLFPGEVAVLLGGVLAFQHRVSLPAAIVAAVAGAVIGDAIGYEIGKRYGRQLLHGALGRVIKPEHLDRAERYLAEKGGKAVFLGRFTAALRVMIPGMAGMSGMRYRRFAAYNLAGGAIWATGFVLLGYAGGSSYRKVESIAKKASLLLLLVFILVGATVFVARRIAHHPERLRMLGDRLANLRMVAAARARFRRQLDFPLRRFPAPGCPRVVAHRLARALGAQRMGVRLGRAGRAQRRVFQPRRPPGARLLRPPPGAVADNCRDLGLVAGKQRRTGPLLAAIGAWLRWRRGTWRPAALLGGGYAGAVALSFVIKPLVGRPRPPFASAVRHFSNYSFPSGHAVQAVVGWGMLAALAAAATPSWSKKVGAWAGAMLIAVLVGGTRLYLGAHWFTDVAGGLLLGALWLSALLTLSRTVPGLRGGDGRADRTAMRRPHR